MANKNGGKIKWHYSSVWKPVILVTVFAVFFLIEKFGKKR